jgi:isopentenyl-diphosphate delta-isomerase
MAEEQLILVDENNRATGTGGKLTVHRAGALHRAFSIFIVDAHGRILLQRRSRGKYHSGDLWANSCCGHPRPGERTLPAARRRLKEELGLIAPLSFGFRSRYQARLDSGLTENELVYVYFGPLTNVPRPDPSEVSDVAFLGPEEIRRRIAREPDAFAYWLRHYFKNHFAEIVRLSKRAARHAIPAAARSSRGKSGSGATIAR